MLARRQFALATEFAATIDEHGRFDAATFFLPASVILGRYTTFNIDLGWSRTRPA